MIAQKLRDVHHLFSKQQKLYFPLLTKWGKACVFICAHVFSFALLLNISCGSGEHFQNPDFLRAVFQI